MELFICIFEDMRNKHIYAVAAKSIEDAATRFITKISNSGEYYRFSDHLDTWDRIGEHEWRSGYRFSLVVDNIKSFEDGGLYYLG